jgi:RNA polymerase sigma factor for flagellar operon FliA
MLNAYPLPTEDNSSMAQETVLLTRYTYLVKRVSNHLRSQVSTVFSRDDLEQVGLMGLLEAIRRYGEPDEAFEGFAFKRIRGAILDELRRQDWRPRRVRQAVHEINHHHRQLYNQLGREPTDEELAAAAGLSVADVRERLYDGQAEEMQCLEDWLAKGGDKPDGAMEQAEQQHYVAEALAQMSERDRLLIALYYQQDMNMKEIALTLGLTESRVCQLHKECLATLNRLLGE